MKGLYFDTFNQEYVLEKDFSVPPERFIDIYPSYMNHTYTRYYRYKNKRLSIAYSEEHKEKADIYDYIAFRLDSAFGEDADKVIMYRYCIPEDKYFDILHKLVKGENIEETIM